MLLVEFFVVASINCGDDSIGSINFKLKHLDKNQLKI